MRAQRQYSIQGLDPESAGRFANAAILAVLTPADWQIGQDLELATATALRDARFADPSAPVYVEVIVHAYCVDVVISGSFQTHVVVRPRSPFSTHVTCSKDAK